MIKLTIWQTTLTIWYTVVGSNHRMKWFGKWISFDGFRKSKSKATYQDVTPLRGHWKGLIQVALELGFKKT